MRGERGWKLRIKGTIYYPAYEKETRIKGIYYCPFCYAIFMWFAYKRDNIIVPFAEYVRKKEIILSLLLRHF